MLDITKRIGRLLEKHTRIKVVYTRDEDVFVPLANRTKMANNADGGIIFMDWQDVGVDEANIQTSGGFLEAEWITGPNGEPMRGIVNTLPLITLS